MHDDDASSVQSSSRNDLMRTPVDFGQLANATKTYPQRSEGSSGGGSSETRLSTSSASLVSHRRARSSHPPEGPRGDIEDMPSSGFRTLDDEKRDLLTKLRRLREQKVHISRDYGMHSNVREMRQEYEMIRSNMQMESSVRFQRKVLIAITSGMEFLNNKYDPFNVDLNGWSETIMDSITDYDQIFERLHQKYKGTATMPPEFELIMAVAGSALTFHLSNTFFKKSMGDAMKNPTAVQNILSEIKRASGGSAPPAPGVPPPPPPFAAAPSSSSPPFVIPPRGVPPTPPPPHGMMVPPPPPPPRGYPVHTGVQSVAVVAQETDSELSLSSSDRDDSDDDSASTATSRPETGGASGKRRRIAVPTTTRGAAAGGGGRGGGGGGRGRGATGRGRGRRGGAQAAATNELLL